MAEIVWSPQPGPQTALIHCPYDEVCYGGARGGGKTDGALGRILIKAEHYGDGVHAIFFRKTLTDLEKTIERAHHLYGPQGMGWKWFEKKSLYVSPAGATLRFRYLARDGDAEHYQGHDYTDVCFEELTQFVQPRAYEMMRATLRSAIGVPCAEIGTCNPGGPGHNWVKGRFIDPNPAGFEVLTEELPDGTIWRRVFIPAKVEDNKIMMANDPRYVSRLYMSGSKELVRAWLEGDWNIVEGAFFDCWSEDMVIKPFTIPEHWPLFRSFDWGSAAPYSCGWWAVASEDYIHYGKLIPKGALIRFRELYGAAAPNKGLKQTAEEVSAAIAANETEDERRRVRYSVADPAIFAEDGGPSIAERMGQPWIPADNKRTPGRGRMGGWDSMRHRMTPRPDNGRPMIYCFDTCKDSIRTIPVLQHAENMPEDLDTDGEDHAADEWRYACMSRPYVNPLVQNVDDRDQWDRAFDRAERRGDESWKTLW